MEATRRDDELQAVKRMICDGWPENRHDVPSQALPYWDYRDEMSTYNGIVYRGERTCIPEELRKNTLTVIHSAHMGIVKCKQRARELVFWPGLNKQIEDVVSRCSTCLKDRKKPPKEPMVIQPIPTLPWSKVGVDLCELNGESYLIMVDYYSNYIEVTPIQKDTRTTVVIKHMKENIARFGIMDTLISDNGPQFTSAQFREFTKTYDINHITSSPNHQQANGLAEKAVQTVKNMIKKCSETGDDIYMALLDLRNTPRDDVTGSPMQRLMGRRAKTLLPITENLRKPESSKSRSVSSKLMNYREQQKKYYDRGTRPRSDLEPGNAVRIHSDGRWKPAEFVRKTQFPRSYMVRAGDQGRELRRNSKMLLNTKEQPHIIEPKSRSHYIPMFPMDGDRPAVQINAGNDVSEATVNTGDVPRTAVPVTNRYGREIRRPKHLNDFV